jgi:hypothetical protein
MTLTIVGSLTTPQRELANYLTAPVEEATLNNFLFGVFFGIETRSFSTPTEPHFYVTIGSELRTHLINEHHANLQKASLPSFAGCLETPAGIEMTQSRIATAAYAAIRESVLRRIEELLEVPDPLSFAAR